MPISIVVMSSQPNTVVMLLSFSGLSRKSTDNPPALNHHLYCRHRHHQSPSIVSSLVITSIIWQIPISSQSSLLCSDNTPSLHRAPLIALAVVNQSLFGGHRLISDTILIRVLIFDMKYPEMLLFHVTGCSLYLEIFIWSGIA